MNINKSLIAIVTILSLFGSISNGLIVHAKGGSFGGRASFSAPRVSAPTVRTSAPTISSPTLSRPTVSAPTISRPTTITSPKPVTVGGVSYSRTGSLVSPTYHPSFSGGYTAPIGSTVYYHDNSLMSWLPFYLIMTNQQHRTAVVSVAASGTTPGYEKAVVEEGTDSMYVWNIIVSLAFVGLLIAGVVWLINRWSKR